MAIRQKAAILPLVLLIVAMVSGCAKHPSEVALRQEFVERRSAFDALADMAAEDSNYSRIADNFTHANWSLPEDQRPANPPAERWAGYRQAFAQLELESGVTIYENSIVLERSSSGLVTSGSSVGFMRAAQLPEGIALLDREAQFDCTLGADGWCAVAKALADDWYLLLEKN